MNFQVPQFEDRRAKIKTVDDIGKQVNLAKAYVSRVRTAAKKEKSLDGKLLLSVKIKEAEGVLRKLRVRFFDIEDEVITRNKSL